MDWRKNRIAIGAMVFIALLALTLWVANRRDRQPEVAAEVPRIELEEELITTLEVRRPEGDAVVLSNASGDWRLTAPLDAEADENNVRSALSRLADLELARVVATRRENYERLQVDDANAVRVTVKADDETLAELAIGKYADGMTMIRVGDRPEVFGARGSLRYAFDRELKAWRNRKVVQVEASKVESIKFESPNGVFEFDRSGDGWAVSQGAKKLKELDPDKVTGIVSSAASLTASDFAPEEVSAARAGLIEPVATVTLTLAENPDPIVLALGGTADDENDVYLRRRDDPTIYLLSKYLANRLQPDPDAFERVEQDSPRPASPQGNGQQPQLPPEIMEQLQEQIRAQQQQR